MTKKNKLHGRVRETFSLKNPHFPDELLIVGIGYVEEIDTGGKVADIQFGVFRM